MTKVSFHWLNDGEETTLPEIPIKGKRELLDLQKKRAKYISALTQYKFLYLGQAALATKKLIKAKGIDKAHEAWIATVDSQFNGMKAMKWDKSEFAENLESWLEDFVYKRLGVEDDSGAHLALEKMAQEIQNDVEGLGDDFAQQQMDYYLIEVYWRLRPLAIKSITTPEGEKEIDWSLRAKNETIDLLAEVLTEEDVAALYETNVVADEDDLDMEELLPKSVADVEGKS